MLADRIKRLATLSPTPKEALVDLHEIIWACANAIENIAAGDAHLLELFREELLTAIHGN